jgi:hypothetical protein
MFSLFILHVISVVKKNTPGAGINNLLPPHANELKFSAG